MGNRMKSILCFDIGGTFIKYACINTNGKILDEGTFPTDAMQGGEDILNRVAHFAKMKIKDFQNEKNQILGIAISTAGQVNPYTGEIVYASSAIPDYIGVNIIDYLGKRLSLPVSVDNDVNCALLAEMEVQEEGVTCLFTIGTGIGGAFSVDGNLIRGKNFNAGELGYLPLGDKTFQELASTKALISQVENVTGREQLSGYEVFELAENDERVAKTVEDFYEILARGISSATLILGSNKIILGGGVSSRKDFAIKIKEKMARYIPKRMLDKITVVSAVNGNNAGVMGAFSWFKKQNEL